VLFNFSIRSVLAIVNFRVANHPQIAGSFSQHDRQNVFLNFLELAENLAFAPVVRNLEALAMSYPKENPARGRMSGA
jgi:hypothetical protein